MNKDEERLKYADVRTALEDAPARFTFYQTVRLLERMFPDRAPVGGFDKPGNEVVRFSVNPSIAFPKSENHDLEMDEDEQARLIINFMGLIGPQGQLPHYYTLLVAEQLRAKKPALRDFLDIFQHRILSLLFRAWEKTRFHITYERSGESPLNQHVLDLLGLGQPQFQDNLETSDDALLFHAGLLAAGPRSAIGLEQLLSSYFGVPVEVEQFVGGWYSLRRGDQCELGADNGASVQLGLGAVAGDEVWDAQARIRLRIGPMSRERYEDFLPTGTAFAPLEKLVRFYTHDGFDVDVRPVLAADEVPGLIIGDDSDVAPALGWATWIRTGDRSREGDEAVLAL